MMFGWQLVATCALVTVGCAPAADGPPETPAQEVPSEPSADPGSEAAKTTAPDCDALIDSYLAERARLNTCETDSDCSEIWPGMCPHGPYYVHREADVPQIWAMVDGRALPGLPPDRLWLFAIIALP